MTDLKTKLVLQLHRAFPSVPRPVIEKYVDNNVDWISESPTQKEWDEFEDQFAIHLTMLDETPIVKPLTKIREESDSNKPQPKPKQTSTSTPTKTPPQALASPIPNELPSPHLDGASGELFQRTLDILDMLSVSFKQEANFKLLCNQIYKGVKYFIQDPTNPINEVIPLKYEDFEKDENILSQIACLCIDYQIGIEAKEKGIFIRFHEKNPEFVHSLNGLLQAFKSHKDESVVKHEATEQRKKYNPQDPNRDERVAAYFEAKKMRAMVGTYQPPMMIAPESVHHHQHIPVEQPAPTNPQLPHQGFEYPAFPSGNDSSNTREMDPIEKRLQYRIDDSHLKFNDPNSYQTQINEYRNKCRLNNHDKVESRGHQTMTWGQMVEKVDIEDREILGKQCLEHTNAFRKQHGLHPLKWEPTMFQIAFVHSKNMGDRKVAFGHDGFDQRAKSMPFSKQSAGENVAYIGGVAKNSMPKVSSCR